MFMFFTPKTAFPIGLDISDLTIKLVQLTKIRDKIKINAIGQIKLAPGVIVNGDIKNQEALTQEIGKLIASPQYGKIESDEVIACLPETQTFIKLISVEKKKDLDESIKAEIEKHIPVPVNELYYDYQVISQGITEDQILIGAAPKTIVDRFTSLLDSLKLSVVALEIEPVSICRSLLAEESVKSKGQSDKNYCLLDIGAKRASLTVYCRNTILFSISLPVSGEEITDSIARKINITSEQAEKAKIICGLDKARAEGAVRDILSDEMGKLVSRIKDSLDFYSSHYSEFGAINKIILCGGGANIKDLPGLLSSELGVESVLGNPFINISSGKEKYGEIFLEKFIINIKKSKGKKTPGEDHVLLQGKELTYATAIGLALRGVFIDEM